MKIGIINNLYPPYNKGGAETIVELVAQGLEKQKHQVFIITTKPRNFKIPKTKTKIYYLSSYYYHLHKLPKVIRLFWHVWDSFNFKNYWTLKKIIQQERADLIITNNLKGISGLTFSLLKTRNIKQIHILHDIQLLHPSGLLISDQEKKLNSKLSRFFITWQKFLTQSPDIVISPSAWLLELHKKHGFFPNSFKTTLLNPFPSHEKESKQTVLVKEKDIFNCLYVGQIEKHKGIFFLISNWLNNGISQSKLFVIGQGAEQEKLKTWIKTNSRVEFLGPKTKAEVKRAMNEADCLIVPSCCYENSPTVIYEAIQAELPVLASGLGGIPEIMKLASGEIFLPQKKQELKAQLEKIKNNYSYYKTQAQIKRKAVEKLNSDQYLKQLNSIIENKF